MGLVDKLDELLAIKPDIAVVPEAGDMSAPSATRVLLDRHLTTDPITISDDDLHKIEAGILSFAPAIVGRRGPDRWR